MSEMNYMSESRIASATSEAMRRVYNYMGLGLLVTAVVSYLISNSETAVRFIFTNWWVSIALFVLQIGLVIYIGARIKKMSPGQALGFFFAYAALLGVTMSFIFLAYTAADITLALGTTMMMFLAMSVFGYVTKMDLTGVGTFAIMGLIGIIIGSVLNWFFRSELLYWIITYAGVVIFVALTAYDTQKIKKWITAVLPTGDEEQLKRVSVLGALTLYLDFINMFLFLLRIFGRR
ncbi:MAG: Bax inhibitor-1/YccA family protein [Anaerolineales bacterium]|nr:Bax inhibitor-1/YccA family protein [Anaerolineales bacterium]